MSENWHEDVLMFHRKFCPERIGTMPKIDYGSIPLRMALIREEVDELAHAFSINRIDQVADACADIIYVTIGAAISSGIDLRPIWDEVQRSNMAKEGGSTREDGKVLKPPGWVGPDIWPRLTNQEPLKR